MAKRNTPADASSKSSTFTIGFETKLWHTADKLRNNMAGFALATGSMNSNQSGAYIDRVPFTFSNN